MNELELSVKSSYKIVVIGEIFKREKIIIMLRGNES